MDPSKSEVRGSLISELPALFRTELLGSAELSFVALSKSKLCGSLISELLSLCRIVFHYLISALWDPEPTNYGLPNEVACLFLGDLCQWLGLCPFSEVVYSYKGEFALTSSNGQGPEYV